MPFKCLCLHVSMDGDVQFVFCFAARLKDGNNRKILDQFARAKRLRKQLEALEQDNFQEDPHVHLNIPNKKLPQFDANEGK